MTQTELVVISAKDQSALVNEMKRIVGFIDRVPDARLVDIAYTTSFTKGEVVISIIAETIQDLRSRLSSAISRMENLSLRRIKDKSGTYYFREHLIGEGKGKLAFVYPNGISFYPDMMRDLVISRSDCRSAFDELEEAIREEGEEFLPSSFIYPPAPYYRRDADVFASGAYAESLVSSYAGSIALTRMMSSIGVEPEGVVGFAGGDLAAMMRSGVGGEKMTRPERVKMIRETYKVVQKAVKHAGLPKVALVSAILRHPDELKPLLERFPKDKVHLSVDFSPRQKTLVIAEELADEVMSSLSTAGIRVLRLPFDRPINTPMCEPIVPMLKKFCDSWMKYTPRLDMYSCVKADKITSWRRRGARDLIAEQWAHCVRFEETIRKMYEDGYRVFIEVGPRGLMSSAIDDTLKEQEHAAIVLNSIHRRGILQLQHAIAQMVALGVKANLVAGYVGRRVKLLDFDSSMSLLVHRDAEMKLSREFPKLMLNVGEKLLGESSLSGVAPKGRGSKAAQRAAVIAKRNARLKRQFEFGAMNPLVSDAEANASSPGVMIELEKVFKLSEVPFVRDFAFGTSQVSYSNKAQIGMVALTPAVGAEIMAEAASLVVPNRNLIAIEDFACRKLMSFSLAGELPLVIRAERVASPEVNQIAVKVQIRENVPGSDFTWASMEATIVMADAPLEPKPVSPSPMLKPRNVHWSGRDIYPSRLSSGKRLRGIKFVEAWSESGLDYEIEAPTNEGAVEFTRFPVWTINPLLIEIVTSGFALWRSHERFKGSFSVPFRFRRMVVRGVEPKVGSGLNCYLRLTGVTPKSQIADIDVSDGNGNTYLEIVGWEELTERVPEEYCRLILQPPTAYLTVPMSAAQLGETPSEVASAFITDIPYLTFERNDEFWLKTLSSIILCEQERRDFAARTGSVSRRTEWLFGRVAAKEAVRRYLKDFHQARWSDADVQIWADDMGKPHAIGEWSDYLSSKLDIAIAHTAQFVIALASANSRVGVDVESVQRDLSEEFAMGVFTREELELAAGTINSSHAIIRFWCAKEAVSKALGIGIRFSPREMIVKDYDPDKGTLTMQLTGGWLEAFKAFKGKGITVSVRTVRDHALAFCFIPTSMFDVE